MAKDSSVAPEVDGDRHWSVTAAGRLLLGAAALGIVNAIVVFLASAGAAPGGFGDELMMSAVLVGLVALLVGTVGLVRLRKNKPGGAGVWVLFVFVLCLGFGGLPSTNARLSTVLSDATSIDAEHARANADVIARAVPETLVLTTTALAAAQVAACLVAAVLFSLTKPRHLVG